MISNELTALLEKAASSNPTLRDILVPGVKERQVAKWLKKAGLSDEHGIGRQIYCTSGGCSIRVKEEGFDRVPLASNTSVVFVELEDAVLKAQFYQEALSGNEALSPAVGRLLPAFVDEWGCDYALDLASSDGRVVYVDLDADCPLMVVYPSATVFLREIDGAIDEARDIEHACEMEYVV